jgi:hypothetical protein
MPERTFPSAVRQSRGHAQGRGRLDNLGFGVGPSRPVLRAIPYPEVTELFCRLPLSTLF